MGVTILKATYLLCFTACVDGLRINRKENSLDTWSQESEEGALLTAPLLQQEIDYLEASGQRAELEKMLETFSGNSIVFIGDSIIRNQYDGLCLLLGAKHSAAEMDKYDGANADYAMDTCNGKGISAAFAFAKHPTPTALSELMSVKGIQQPSVIYWDASQEWAKYKSQAKGNYFQPSTYRTLVEQAVETYKKEAPNAKMLFFLAHSRGNIPLKPISVDDQLMTQLNSIGQETMQAHKDGQGRNVKIVDGFSFTKDHPTFTIDGVHYNKLVWGELKMMLQELQGM